MKKTKRFIRYLIEQGVFFLGYLGYLVTGKNHDRIFQAMISVFCFDGGITSDLYARAFHFFQKPYEINQASGLFGNLDKQKLEQIQSELETKGYCTADVLVPEELCQQLEQLTKGMRAFPVKASPEGVAPAPRIYDAKNEVSPRYNYICGDLAQIEIIQDIMADESLMAVANSYFKAAPVLDSVVMSLSTDFSKTASSDAAQMFHFDMDRIKWLKYFLYLTDVDDMTGPHVFVEGTHRSGHIPQTLLKRGYVRIEDDDVAKQFPAEKIKVFKFRRGTLFVEDTRGLHKGMVLKKGQRLLLQAQYNLGLFGTADLQAHNVDEVKSGALKKMIKKYPNLYKNYNFRSI